MYTYTFRDLARYCARVTDTSIISSWTDYRRDRDSEERIVTLSVARNEKHFLDMLGKLMELAGVDAQSHGLRVTDGGYVKCNCTKPTLVKLN